MVNVLNVGCPWVFDTQHVLLEQMIRRYAVIGPLFQRVDAHPIAMGCASFCAGNTLSESVSVDAISVNKRALLEQMTSRHAMILHILNGTCPSLVMFSLSKASAMSDKRISQAWAVAGPTWWT